MPSQEFVQAADQILGHILYYMSPQDKETARGVTYYVEDNASPMAKMATGTPDSWHLLGMYQTIPRRVTLFEDGVRWFGQGMGSLNAAIEDTLQHEIYQHVMGYDHVKETLDAGLTPAYAKPCG